MAKAFYIRELVIDSDSVQIPYTDIKLVKTIPYVNIWTPDKQLYYRSANKVSVRYDYLTHKSYSSLDWSKTSSEEKDEVRKHSTIKEIIESYSYFGFGNVRLDYGYIWSNSSNHEIVFPSNTNSLDFGDTIFSTDLDYLKEIELLE